MGSSFAITDAAGKLFDLKSAEPPKLEILKRGPLYVVLRYTGRLALDTSYSAPFVVTVEMPNSKSWIRVTAKVDDPGKRCERSRIGRHFRLVRFLGSGILATVGPTAPFAISPTRWF